MPNFSAFDATERRPRPIQLYTLRKLSDQWNKEPNMIQFGLLAAAVAFLVALGEVMLDD